MFSRYEEQKCDTFVLVALGNPTRLLLKLRNITAYDSTEMGHAERPCSGNTFLDKDTISGFTSEAPLVYQTLMNKDRIWSLLYNPNVSVETQAYQQRFAWYCLSL